MDTHDTRAGPGAKESRGSFARQAPTPDQPPAKDSIFFYPNASRGDLPTAPTGAAYLRSATSGPEGLDSLEIQRKAVLAVSDSLGVTIPLEQIISEVGSGISPDRPGLHALWDLVESEAVQHIFVRDIARLGRDIPGVLRFFSHCEDHAVTLHFAEDYSLVVHFLAAG